MTDSPPPVRFDEARQHAFLMARTVAEQGFDTLLVRDTLGRFSLIVDDAGKSGVEGLQGAWEREAEQRLGPYRSDQAVLLTSEMFSAGALLNSPRATADESFNTRSPGSVRFLDNTVVGEDWARVSDPVEVSGDGGRAHRTALYGFKGGVGRTTAMAMLARRLADRGHAVLVVDLDLESPGAGPLLMGRDLPPHGLVDHLVESGLGNADGLDLVVRSPYKPPRATEGQTGEFGELWVAPARGQGTEDTPYSYVDKLNRVYTDTADATFAERLEQAVRACEDAVERVSDTGRRPDVVLLDSRAGIHDVAAVAISRLCDLALLFGSDNEQTWAGYGDLFTAWQSSGQAARIRERLRMVASMVPDSVHHTMETYLERFRGRAHECFEVLYDEVEAYGEDEESSKDEPDGDGPGESEAATELPFAPGRHEEWAPHWAIPILFEPGLVGMDASNAPGWQDRAFVQAAYGEFLKEATELIENALPAREGREGRG
ncbi:KGGVGR-motif variant AAA ATPase [Streptomyces cinereoruber]|uniref:KGGVGR-motif variant AAA ATPase n=1 Tax=Streptomyces cinereoruber TaxID=67260 RepID=UPI00364E2CD7